MKRTVSIALLTLFLFNFLGFYILSSVIKSDLRSDMEEHMRNGTPEILKICRDDESLIWIDAEEIEYKGKLYDIVKIEDQGELLKIHCFHDAEEQKHAKSMERHLDHHAADHDKTKHKSKVNLQLVLLVYVPEPLAGYSVANKFTRTNSDFYTSRLSDIFHDVLSPPPRA